MLRYDRQTKPGLVALYDIRPGNGAGPFLQPRSPHRAVMRKLLLTKVTAGIQNQKLTGHYLVEREREKERERERERPRTSRRQP